jgi:nicotinate-nucleotide pyrophosphorylase (carboxylating)
LPAFCFVFALCPLSVFSAVLPSYLSESHLDAIVRRALDEDVGSGDVTTLATVEAGQAATGTIRTKEAGVLAGAAVATRVFEQVDARAEADWPAGDGDRVDAGTTVARIEGPARALLVGERLALNVLQRMSGIATATRRMVEAARPHGARILDTRKTVPGLRPLDKWAVRLGGGTNHRIGLFDQILIKDNHIAAAGGVAEALDAAAAYREANDPSLDVEVETRTLAEVRAAAGHGAADILLLDNMVEVGADGSVDTSRLAEAVDLVDGRARTEASGNVTRETVAPIAATGVDAISSGALTHSVTALDLSMEMEVLGC